MPFGADTPTPEFVGNSRVRGARSPPGTPRDPTTPLPGTPRPGGWAHRPARRLRQSKVEKCAARRTSSRQSGEAPPGGLHQSKVRKSCARVDFSRAKRRSVPPAGLHQSKVEKSCARANFSRAKRRSVPSRASPEQSPKAEPGGGCARRAKKTRFSENFFSPPTRIYKRKRGLLFRKKRT